MVKACWIKVEIGTQILSLTHRQVLADFDAGCNMGIGFDARCNTSIGRDVGCDMGIDLDARMWHGHWLALSKPLSAPGDVGTIGRTPLPNSLFLLFYLFYALFDCFVTNAAQLSLPLHQQLVSEPGWYQMALNPSAKFEVGKFDGTSNFGLWQKRVMDVLAQQGLSKALRENKPDGMDQMDWNKVE
ncbi:hypothetical protein Lal_00037601 [Lupinus albus]|nr:hypothetical protein Lal_00037601 [Lupinus albus]